MVRHLFALYGLLADYGFSVKRPILAWLLFTGACAALYGIGMSASRCWLVAQDCIASGALTGKWIEYSLLNALPLPGLDRYAEEIRKALFEAAHPLVSLLVLFTGIVHKTASLVAVFLVALALRNLFKMKG